MSRLFICPRCQHKANTTKEASAHRAQCDPETHRREVLRYLRMSQSSARNGGIRKNEKKGFKWNPRQSFYDS